MINIFFFGNCQSGAILNLLNLDKNKYSISNEVCFATKISQHDFLNIIKKSDIIITQPIKDNYREKNYLNTNFIIKNSNKNTKIIIFDSCYFNFYYPDLTYINFNNNLLNEPIPYHYNHMIKFYKDKKLIEEYIKNCVNNNNLYSSEELINNANKSLEILKEKYNDNIKKYKKNNVFIISIYDYVKNNYKKKLLFYSMNHPSKFVLQYICENIIKILNIKNTINYNIDPLSNPKNIIYKCIQKVVNFDIKKCNIKINNKENINEITKIYFDTYKKINYN